VAKGKGQMEFFLASPTTSLSLDAKKPSPAYPSGAETSDIGFSKGLLVILY
jgi:hypothetical protein